MDLPYDTDFLFDECGFGWVPAHIDRSLVFNVSYEVGTGEIKLYVLDPTRTLLHKVSRSGITVQRSVTATRADLGALAAFLGNDLDFEDLLPDTVEDDTYYLYIEPSTPSQYVAFLGAVCRALDFPKSRLVEVANRINRRQVANVYECMVHRCVSGVKVPLRDGPCKLYSRPFVTGNGFDLDAATERFLRRLYRCDTDLAPHLRHMWVSGEIASDRLVLTTQRHAMLHGRT